MKYIIITISILFSLSLASQEVLTVESAIKIALENNHGINMAKNNAEMMQNSATAGNAGLLPQVNLTGGLNYSNGESMGVNGTQEVESTSGNAGLSLNYTLFDGLGTIYNYQGLKLNAESGALQSKYIIENTIVQVVTSYYILSSCADNVKLMQEMFDISRERLEREAARNEFGTSSTLQVLSAKVDFNNDSISYINSIKSYEQAKHSFNALLGRDAATSFDIISETFTYAVYEFAEMANLAYDKNLAYQLSKLGYSQAELDQKLASTNLYPSLSLNSSYGYNQTNTGFAASFDDPLMNFTTGITLSYNLYNGGQSKIRRQNARLSLENSQLEVNESKLTLEKDLMNALLDYNNSLAILHAEQENIESAALNFDQAKEYYQLGQISATQFREAQSNLIRSKTTINSANYNAKIAETELKRLSGQILS